MILVRWCVLVSTLIFYVSAASGVEESGLSAEQEKALNSLIDSLQALKATPESATKIKELIGVDTEDLKKRIEDYQTRIAELKEQVAEAERKREKLKNRLNALESARILLGLEQASSDTPADSPSPVSSASPPASPSPNRDDFFATKVFPIFRNNCIGCHGPEKQKAGLRLDSRDAMIEGGDFGSVLTPGHVEKSYLIEVIRYAGETKMPPKEKLPDESIEIIVQWVEQGAPWGPTDSPSEEKSPKAPAKSPPSSPKPEGSNPGETLFTQQVFPILEKKCFECHGPEKQKSGLRLDSLDAILKGSEYGPVLKPGQPDESVLLKVLYHDGDVAMPPKEKLPAEDIEAIKKWIEQGAPWPKS